MGEPVQRNLRTHGGTRGWSGQNTESCTGASCDRCDFGSDGKTHRLHGRRDNTERSFCACLQKPARGGNWDPQFYPGVFVGMLNSSSRSSGCHRARVGDQSTCCECHENSQVGERDVDSILAMRATPPGDVLMESNVARTYFRRADFGQWGLSEWCPGVPVSENWPGETTSAQ